MLAQSTYPQAVLAAARADVDAAVAAFAALPASPETKALEPLFFNHLLVAMDARFVHRVRNKEGKDGNPLNEVRVLCGSLNEHGGVTTYEKSIRMKPEATVLGHAPGDAIALSREAFAALAGAYFAELAARYGEG